jgi:hypothetical protein
MAKNLLESLAETGPSYTEQARGLLRAKTGKAVTSEGPVASEIAETQASQAAGQAVQSALRGAGLQQQQQQEQLATIEQKSDQELENLDLALTQQAKETQRRIDEAFTKLSQESSQLDAQKQAALYEQLGSDLALQNEKYIADLQNEATRRRLDDKAQADLALQSAVFSDMMDLLESDIEFRKALDADDRVFAEKMAQIDVDAALNIALQQMKTEAMASNYQQVASGVGKLGDWAASKEGQETLKDWWNKE